MGTIPIGTLGIDGLTTVADWVVVPPLFPAPVGVDCDPDGGGLGHEGEAAPGVLDEGGTVGDPLGSEMGGGVVELDPESAETDPGAEAPGFIVQTAVPEFVEGTELVLTDSAPS